MNARKSRVSSNNGGICKNRESSNIKYANNSSGAGDSTKTDVRQYREASNTRDTSSSNFMHVAIAGSTAVPEKTGVLWTPGTATRPATAGMPRTIGTPERAVARATHDFPQRFTKNRKMVYSTVVCRIPLKHPPFQPVLILACRQSNSLTSINSAGLAMKPILFVLAILAQTKGSMQTKNHLTLLSL